MPDTVDPHYGRIATAVEAELMWHAVLRNDIPLRFARADDPKVSVVVVARNAARMLLWTLLKLSLQQTLEHAAFEVIIVDNASDDAVAMLLRRVENAQVIRNEADVGFGPACNAGAAVARAAHLLFLNPDVALMPGAITALIETFSEADAVGIVGGRLVFPGGYLQEAGGFFRRDGQITHNYGRGCPDPLLPECSFLREVAYVSGALLMIEAALFRSLDGFDDLFAPAYFEDTDLCVRARQAGRRVMYQPRAIAIHVENATSPAREDIEALIDRNRDRFAARHADWLSGYPDAPPRLADRDERRFALRVLVIDDAVPHVDRGAGLPRTNAIVWTMVRLGYQVTMYPMYRGDDDPATTYRDLPPGVEILRSEGFDGLRRIVGERADYYDVLWVCRPHNIGAVCQCLHDKDSTPRAFARSRVVFDTESVFALRDFDRACLDGGWVDDGVLALNIRDETRNLPLADHVVCVSDAEACLIETYVGVEATVLGHAMPIAGSPTPGFHERSGLLFVGALTEEDGPNADALTWFVTQVFEPLRRRLPDLALTIVGEIGLSLCRRFERPGVGIMGQVADVGSYFDHARVFVAPTRYAAGVPHKVHQAVALGLPAVVTPILAAQVGWPDGVGYRVSDWGAEADFAQAVLDLHTSPALWSQVQHRGLARVRLDCDAGRYAGQIKRICEAPVFA